jgi:hypothetical protein
MNRELLRILSTLLALVLWGCKSPSVARYEFREDHNGHLIRLDHDTGDQVIVSEDNRGWVLLSRPLMPPNLPKDPIEATRPSTDLSKITWGAVCDPPNQSFGGRLYNGTGFVLRTIGLDVNNRNHVGPFIIRDLYIRPFEVKVVSTAIIGLESGKCEWRLTHAYGSPWKDDRDPSAVIADLPLK